MAIAGVDGFDHYGSDHENLLTLDSVENYTVDPYANDIGCVPSDRFGQGKCLRIFNSSFGLRVTDTELWATNDVMVVSFAYKVGPNQNESDWVVRFRGAGGLQCGLYWNWADGLLRFYRSDSVIKATSTNVLNKDQWYWIEVKVKIGEETGVAGTWGYAEVRVDGTSTGWINATNIDTLTYTNAPILSGFYFAGHGNADGEASYYDDLVWQDDDSPDFIGDHRITTLFPLADTATAQFTPSVPTGEDNAAHVAEDLHDDADIDAIDNTYVYSSTPGHKDLYNYDTIDTADTIKAVSVYSRARKTDTQARTFRNVHSGTGGDGVTKALGTDYATYRDTWETSNGVDAWTQTTVGSTDFGVEVVS